FVVAIAHVRGGGDLGEEWYRNGKMLKKKNTFTDFISCTEHLIASGYGEKGKVIAEGGSAGGLLMGAVANMRPDLYQLLILDVPFVDVINTMLDDKLPLTTQEYPEWGNPNEKKYFKYIKSYSPYENVAAKDYPNMLFLTAINDSRVGYWEPAKMVAKLRALKTDQNEIFLRTDFSAGHGGASGRYASLSETALKYSLILDLVNQTQIKKPFK
ncbi:MAG: prolyl oligopeptidase family serine peptidase, partial [Bacteroidota bacterium]